MMSDATERLACIGGRLLIKYSTSLIALIDEHGGLIEINPSLRRYLSVRPEVTNILSVLEPHSRLRLQKLIQHILVEEQTDPITIHLIKNSLDIPQSYHCFLAATGANEIVFIAEPIPPLDERAAEEYVHITSELAMTTRSLQKTSHELAKKQRALEEALAMIEQIARIDDLTRLLNRRSVLLALNNEVERVRRYQAEVSVLLIDIDHFKQINDRYGHPVGDQVLRQCADRLQHSIRTTDYVGRYGGEEFLCVLPMTGPQAAADLARRLAREMAQTTFTVNDMITFSVTISIGVTTLEIERDSTEILIAHADHALYQAKKLGRNRVVVWQP